MSGVVIDANLLCLWVVGAFQREAIGRHARLRAFDGMDFENLAAIFDRLGEPVLCPQVLAETSNLITYRVPPGDDRRWRRSLALVIERHAERAIESRRAITDPAYDRLGLTDAVLIMLATDPALHLLSDDLGLCLEAARRGLRAINYNHIRDGALTIDQLQ